MISIISCFILFSCSLNKSTISKTNFSDIYKISKQKLCNNDYTGAIKELKKLNKYYPLEFYEQRQVQLDMIYAYYKSSEFNLTKSSISRFLRFNPNDIDTDYAIYILGLTNMALDNNPLLNFFCIDNYDRNLEHVSEAFYDFMQLIIHYPNSQYVMDAMNRLVYLKNKLARHELAIVKYYDRLGAYIAVINRVEQMLRDFPDTKATRQALLYMEIAYHKLQLNNQAAKVLKIRRANPIIY